MEPGGQIRFEVAELRRPCAQRRQRPAGVASQVGQNSGGDPEGKLQAIADVTVPLAGLGDVDRHDENLASGDLRTLQQPVRQTVVLRHVDLKPQVSVCGFGELFKRCRGGCADRVGHALLGSQPSDHHVGAGPGQVEKPQRSHAEGHRVGFAEDCRLGGRRRHVDQVSRKELDVGKCLSVLPEIVLALRATVDEIESESWHSPLGDRSQIVDRSGALKDSHVRFRSADGVSQ